MTKNELGEGVRLVMGYTNQNARVDEQVVWWAADRVRRKFTNDYLRINGDMFRGEFCKAVAVPVKFDKVRNRKYIDAAGFLNMPNNGAIASVGLTQSDEAPFILTSVGQIGIYQGLESSDIGTTYWQEGGRYYFDSLGNEVAQVLVIGMPTLESLQENDHIPMPSIIEADIVNAVAQMLGAGIKEVPQSFEDNTRQSLS